MCSNNIIGYGQTQPEVIFIASGFFTAVKAVKYLYLLFVADSDTCVRNFDFKVFAHVSDGQADFSVFWCIADGVVKENCEHLHDAFTVTYAVREWFFGEGGADSDVFRSCHALKSLAGIQDKCVELGCRWFDVEMSGVAA